MSWKGTLFLISVFPLFYLVLKNYWRIVVYFNPQVLNLKKTPDAHPISNADNYYRKIEDGKELMSQSKVIIAGLVRDVAHSIEIIRKKTEFLGQQFKEYRIVLVENDSNDNTQEQLAEWANENRRLCILNVNATQHELKVRTKGHRIDKTRLDKMTHLRNIYLDFVKTEYSHWDYLIVWDLDIIGSVYLDGIQNSFGHLFRDEINALFAYGIYKWFGFKTIYYDTFAHIDYHDHFNIAKKRHHDLYKAFSVKGLRGDELRKVRSGFSGFCIYRMNSLIEKDAKYRLTPKEELLCEHTTLCDSLDGIYMNPSMIYRVLEN